MERGPGRAPAALAALAMMLPSVLALGAEHRNTGGTRMTVREVRIIQGAPVVLLQTDGTAKRLLPLWIGAAEAQAIQLRLSGARTPRPLTHDLLESMLGTLSVKVERVEIDDLRDNIFIGKITLRDGRGRRHRIDGRPSDLIALALGAKLAIHVAPHVLRKAGVAAGWTGPDASPPAPLPPPPAGQGI